MRFISFDKAIYKRLIHPLRVCMSVLNSRFKKPFYSHKTYLVSIVPQAQQDDEDNQYSQCAQKDQDDGDGQCVKDDQDK